MDMNHMNTYICFSHILKQPLTSIVWNQHQPLATNHCHSYNKSVIPTAPFKKFWLNPLNPVESQSNEITWNSYLLMFPTLLSLVVAGGPSRGPARKRRDCWRWHRGDRGGVGGGEVAAVLWRHGVRKCCSHRFLGSSCIWAAALSL